jgi:enoyl-CoA hydratase
MSQNSCVYYTVNEQGIATVTLARPEVSNALNEQMALELKDVFAALPTSVKVVVITGAGERAFCAGADLKDRRRMNVEDWQLQHQAFRHAIQLISECHQPVIAAVNGAAFGGGLEIALTCDFIYASSNATFALPEVKLGIIPGLGGTQRLPRAIGIGRAKELLFTGAAFGAQEAYACGLANHVSEPGKLMEDVMDCAQRIAANAPLAVKAVKRASSMGMNTTLDRAITIESDQYNTLVKSEDRHEGINAYNEKRAPKFTGK